MDLSHEIGERLEEILSVFPRHFDRTKLAIDIRHDVSSASLSDLHKAHRPESSFPRLDPLAIFFFGIEMNFDECGDGIKSLRA